MKKLLVLIVKTSVDESILAWWAAKGVEPAGAQAFSWED